MDTEITLEDLLSLKSQFPADFNNGKIYFNHGWDNKDEKGKKIGHTFTIDLYRTTDAACTFSLHPFYPSGNARFKENQILLIGVQMYWENKYLLTRVVRVKKIEPKEYYFEHQDEIAEVEDIPEFSKWCGRVIFSMENKNQNDVLNIKGTIEKCKVIEVLSKPYGGEDFPGYKNVCISMRELKYYLENTSAGEEWKNKLKDRCAIYCLYNDHENKFYIGSAYGKDGVIGRWDVYLKTTHGNNKGLKELFDKYAKDENYFLDHFQFSILEALPIETETAEVIDRENFWKKVFDSQNPNNGYNKN